MRKFVENTKTTPHRMHTSSCTHCTLRGCGCPETEVIKLGLMCLYQQLSNFQSIMRNVRFTVSVALRPLRSLRERARNDLILWPTEHYTFIWRVIIFHLNCVRAAHKHINVHIIDAESAYSIPYYVWHMRICPRCTTIINFHDNRNSRAEQEPEPAPSKPLRSVRSFSCVSKTRARASATCEHSSQQVCSEMLGAMVGVWFGVPDFHIHTLERNGLWHWRAEWSKVESSLGAAILRPF